MANKIHSKIELKENLLVKIEGSKDYRFKGTRIFTKK